MDGLSRLGRASSRLIWPRGETMFLISSCRTLPPQDDLGIRFLDWVCLSQYLRYKQINTDRQSRGSDASCDVGLSPRTSSLLHRRLRTEFCCKPVALPLDHSKNPAVRSAGFLMPMEAQDTHHNGQQHASTEGPIPDHAQKGVEHPSGQLKDRPGNISGGLGT